MTKCFVEPVREVVSGVRVLTDTESEYDYEYKRGMTCDQKAPACKEWVERATGISLINPLLSLDIMITACCNNCYFCHEVKE